MTGTMRLSYLGWEGPFPPFLPLYTAFNYHFQTTHLPPFVIDKVGFKTWKVLTNCRVGDLSRYTFFWNSHSRRHIYSKRSNSTQIQIPRWLTPEEISCQTSLPSIVNDTCVGRITTAVQAGQWATVLILLDNNHSTGKALLLNTYFVP